jgi:hypothetical protein
MLRVVTEYIVIQGCGVSARCFGGMFACVLACGKCRRTVVAKAKKEDAPEKTQYACSLKGVLGMMHGLRSADAGKPQKGREPQRWMIKKSCSVCPEANKQNSKKSNVKVCGSVWLCLTSARAV